MNIKITTFINPFSFFCVSDNVKNEGQFFFENTDASTSTVPSKPILSDKNHGQYVLVMWKSKWNRGIINVDTQFLIWLIDYGIYIRPNEKTVYIDLPIEYKKYPTKVFEASIHGVVPIDKGLSEDCKINNKITTQWNQGTIERAKELLSIATKTIFYPLAILSTKYNDIVLGDLILEIPHLGHVNIIDELEMWPIFLERNQEVYIKDLPCLYNNRRRHRASQLKPSFQDYDLPCITLENALIEYKKIANSVKNIVETLDQNSCSSDETDGSVITSMCNGDDSAFKITPADIEKYSQRYICINDRKYNVLNVLINKARDLRICEQYKDHDVKCIGRGCSYKPSGV